MAGRPPIPEQRESRIFGQAYDTTSPSERPCYGALNLGHAPAGAAPRFGLAHLRLASGVLAHTTFCYTDGVYEPSHFGVFDRFALVEHLLSLWGMLIPLTITLRLMFMAGC